LGLLTVIMQKIVPQRKPASGSSDLKNKNVSSSALSRSERAALAELRVITGVGRKGSCSSRPRSEVWKYYGYLHVAKDDAGPSTSTGSVSYEPLNDERIYCK
jgi:hypothetical protein